MTVATGMAAKPDVVLALCSLVMLWPTGGVSRGALLSESELNLSASLELAGVGLVFKSTSFPESRFPAAPADFLSEACSGVLRLSPLQAHKIPIAAKSPIALNTKCLRMPLAGQLQTMILCYA
jgi:hypothetical protein